MPARSSVAQSSSTSGYSRHASLLLRSRIASDKNISFRAHSAHCQQRLARWLVESVDVEYARLLTVQHQVHDALAGNEVHGVPVAAESDGEVRLGLVQQTTDDGQAVGRHPMDAGPVSAGLGIGLGEMPCQEPADHFLHCRRDLVVKAVQLEQSPQTCFTDACRWPPYCWVVSECRVRQRG